MSNERIDLTQFEVKKYEEEYDEMQDMAPTEYLDLVLDMRRKLIAELKRCYEKNDWLQQVADLAADNIGRKNWDGFEEAMYEAGLWERPSE